MRFADILYCVQVKVRGAIKRTADTCSIYKRPMYLVSAMPTVDLVADGNTAVRMEQLTRALELIRSYYPPAYARLIHDIRRILIDDTIPRQAMYFIGTRSCTLRPELFGSTDATVATALVHEGIHARLDARNVIQTGARRKRAERACARAEIRFVSRFPSTSALEQWIHQRSIYAASLLEGRSRH
jgi:hypothetical protein